VYINIRARWAAGLSRRAPSAIASRSSRTHTPSLSARCVPHVLHHPSASQDVAVAHHGTQGQQVGNAGRRGTRSAANRCFPRQLRASIIST